MKDWKKNYMPSFTGFKILILHLNISNFQRKFISNGMINLKVLDPHGILLHNLNDMAIKDDRN